MRLKLSLLYYFLIITTFSSVLISSATDDVRDLGLRKKLEELTTNIATQDDAEHYCRSLSLTLFRHYNIPLDKKINVAFYNSIIERAIYDTISSQDTTSTDNETNVQSYRHFEMMKTCLWPEEFNNKLITILPEPSKPSYIPTELVGMNNEQVGRGSLVSILADFMSSFVAFEKKNVLCTRLVHLLAHHYRIVIDHLMPNFPLYILILQIATHELLNSSNNNNNQHDRSAPLEKRYFEELKSCSYHRMFIRLKPNLEHLLPLTTESKSIVWPLVSENDNARLMVKENKIAVHPLVDSLPVRFSSFDEWLSELHSGFMQIYTSSENSSAYKKCTELVHYAARLFECQISYDVVDEPSYKRLLKRSVENLRKNADYGSAAYLEFMEQCGRLKLFVAAEPRDEHKVLFVRDDVMRLKLSESGAQLYHQRNIQSPSRGNSLPSPSFFEQASRLFELGESSSAPADKQASADHHYQLQQSQQQQHQQQQESLDRSLDGLNAQIARIHKSVLSSRSSVKVLCLHIVKHLCAYYKLELDFAKPSVREMVGLVKFALDELIGDDIDGDKQQVHLFAMRQCVSPSYYPAKSAPENNDNDTGGGGSSSSGSRRRIKTSSQDRVRVIESRYSPPGCCNLAHRLTRCKSSKLSFAKQCSVYVHEIASFYGIHIDDADDANNTSSTPPDVSLYDSLILRALVIELSENPKLVSHASVLFECFLKKPYVRLHDESGGDLLLFRAGKLQQRKLSGQKRRRA